MNISFLIFDEWWAGPVGFIGPDDDDINWLLKLIFDY